MNSLNRANNTLNPLTCPVWSFPFYETHISTVSVKLKKTELQSFLNVPKNDCRAGLLFVLKRNKVF